MKYNIEYVKPYTTDKVVYEIRSMPIIGVVIYDGETPVTPAKAKQIAEELGLRLSNEGQSQEYAAYYSKQPGNNSMLQWGSAWTIPGDKDPDRVYRNLVRWGFNTSLKACNEASIWYN